MFPRADLEDSLLGIHSTRETGERRGRTARGVADLGGVAAGDADSGRDVRRQLRPEIAEACGVSEKTVFNYFPTKESLILDRLESTMASLKSGLTRPGAEPAEAALQILDDELTAMTSWLTAQDDLAQASAAIRRFGALIQATPSLRAHQSDMMDQFTAVAAEILARRIGMSPDEPEPQIAATALLGLWRIQFQALSK